MSATEAPAAGVEAAEQVDTKSTTPEATPAKETKETKSTKVDSQADADKEIAEDLAEEDKKKAKEDPLEADDTAEEEEPEEADADKAEEEVEPEESEEEKAERAKGAEARKTALQTEIRELVSKRNELRGEVEQEIAKAYRTETPEELVDQGLSPEEAENEALKQEMQMREFNTHVADLNAQLNIESLQVMQDFPVFDSESSAFDEQLSKRVRSLYEQAAQPQVDEKTGLVVKSNIPPYEFYKAFAETHEASGQKSRTEGQLAGQKATEKNLAAAETPSSTAPRKQAEDPFLKGLLSKDD